MKGLPTLTGGSNILTVLIQPDDASDLGVLDGADVTVSSATGSITLPAAVRDDIAPGCLCIPHGWAEANVNALVDVEAIDAFAGTAVLSGLAVDLATAHGRQSLLHVVAIRARSPRQSVEDEQYEAPEGNEPEQVEPAREVPIVKAPHGDRDGRQDERKHDHHEDQDR